ncbi:MAG: radical SAM protein [Pseudomonadota bacterium]
MSYFLDIPEQIKISLTNICNYKCKMCPNQLLKQKRGFITDDLVYRILDECAELGVKSISLGGTGEPLMHKKLIEYLARAKSYGFYVSTTSNCSLMNKEIAEKLLSEKLDRLCISIYSSDNKSHQNYTGTDSFTQASENIIYFLKSWKERKSEMLVNMWFLSIPGINDQREFLNFWQPIANEVGLQLTIKQPINWGGRVEIYGEDISKKKIFVRKNETNYEIVNKQSIRCEHVRNYLFVLHDGTVVPCCNIQESDPEGKIVFGNLNNEKIIDIWKGEKFLAFKNAHYKKKIQQYPLCRDCSEVIAEITWQLSLGHYIEKAKNRLLAK